MGYALQAIVTNYVLEFAFQADLRSFKFAPGKFSQLFKFDPVKFVGPAKVCPLKLMDSVLNITFSVMARRASHRDVTSKFNPIEFSPANNTPE